MDVHEYCDLFPEMAPEEFEDFCKSVAKHGVRTPVVVYQGKIVDGKHRAKAAAALSKTLPTIEWDGVGSLLDFVVDANLHRRHLATGQRAAT